MKRTLLLIIVLILLLVSLGWSVQRSVHAVQSVATNAPTPVTVGMWNAHTYDLVYTVAFSSEQQPNGPLVVYRASGSDLRTSVPVIALRRDPLLLTPLFFPSPNGQFLALSTAASAGYATGLNGADLSILPTDGSTGTLVLPRGVAADDQLIWSADSQALYYHSGTEQQTLVGMAGRGQTVGLKQQHFIVTGLDEIHRIALNGQDSILFSRPQDASSLHIVGLDRSGALILTLARAHAAVELLRLDTNGTVQAQGQPILGTGLRSPPATMWPLSVIATLPPDIMPGNVLRVGSDGVSVECERVLSWNPLRFVLVHVSFSSGAVSQVTPPFDTTRFGQGMTPLQRSADGQVLVMSQALSTRSDLEAEGIAGVPAQEAIVLADTQSGATQRLELPPGGQIVQAFWTAHLPMTQLHPVSQSALAGLLAFRESAKSKKKHNVSVFQQDEWMLEGHAGRLLDAPPLPSMCYGYCPQGFGPPHVSAAILHGVAYVESDWHQFNTADFRVNGEAPGTPVESSDGGWGEFQQTWGMPPQCIPANNCRSDASQIEHDQSYNIGTGVQALIHDWNATAGVISPSDPNDPYKANHWFFAVWAYNGAYGNNPNDVPSSDYGHWYPGAPFRTIYEEYVWYFAAHPQYLSNGWTDNYLPALGRKLLPPQSDFVNTADSFVHCVTCTIPDWTTGSYDNHWVGLGAPDVVEDEFKAAFDQLGGEDVIGLPRDNGGGAANHRWGPGWVQDFGGGSDLPGELLLADGTTTPYWVHGGIWTQYFTVDAGAIGCHGYPTSNVVAFTGPGPDSYVRQSFQVGGIVWDATTHAVVLDACA